MDRNRYLTGYRKNSSLIMEIEMLLIKDNPGRFIISVICLIINFSFCGYFED